jgi:hypothetical protein
VRPIPFFIRQFSFFAFENYQRFHENTRRWADIYDERNWSFLLRSFYTINTTMKSRIFTTVSVNSLVQITNTSFGYNHFITWSWAESSLIAVPDNMPLMFERGVLEYIHVVA